MSADTGTLMPTQTPATLAMPMSPHHVGCPHCRSPPAHISRPLRASAPVAPELRESPGALAQPGHLQSPAQGQKQRVGAELEQRTGTLDVADRPRTAELRTGSSPKAQELLASREQPAPQERPGPSRPRGKLAATVTGAVETQPSPPHVQPRVFVTPPRSGLAAAHTEETMGGPAQESPEDCRFLDVSSRLVSMTSVRHTCVPVPP